MWLGGKGTGPSEMKVYPHPAQNTQAMTGRQKEKKYIFFFCQSKILLILMLCFLEMDTINKKQKVLINLTAEKRMVQDLGA